jgi:uroporphyrinogen-III synthase
VGGRGLGTDPSPAGRSRAGRERPRPESPRAAQPLGEPRRLRVVVVRSEPRAGSLATRLEAAGFDVVLCPLVGIEPLGDGPVELGDCDWLVVTSPNAADELARRGVRGSARRVAAVGPGTATALRQRAALRVDLVPAVSTQEGLLEELPRPAGRVVVAAAAGARRLLIDELDAELLPLYRTVELPPPEPPHGDLVALAAASQARAFAKLGVAIPAVTIGPLTTAAAREYGLEVVAEAEPHDLDGLVAAVERAAESR